MVASIGNRSIVGPSEMQQAACRIAEKLREVAPTRVLFIQTSGERLGKSIATLLGIPVDELDIRYPASRLPKSLRTALFPIKELLYKITRPTIRWTTDAFSPTERIVLVDDSASSGKTLRLALSYLQNKGLDRTQICTVVYRRGPGAADVVDYFETAERVIFRNASVD